MLYPAATEQELSYYVSGEVLLVIGNESYVFTGLVNPVFVKSSDTVTAHVAVQYLDQRTGMKQISQFILYLTKEENWKIIKDNTGNSLLKISDYSFHVHLPTF